MFLWEEITLTGNNLQSDWQKKQESVGKGRHDSGYKLFPKACLKYSKDVITFAVKIRITLLLSVTSRCSIQLKSVLGRKVVLKVKVRLKTLSTAIFPQYLWHPSMCDQVLHRGVEARFPSSVFLGLCFPT